MVGMYDQGGGLLEKLQQLGIRKLSQMLPKAGAAIGTGLGGPAGGYVGEKIGGGLESILEAGLSGRHSPYEGLGMSPEQMGLEGMPQPSMMDRLMQQGTYGLGSMAGEGAMSGLGSLAGLMGGSGSQGMGMLEQMPPMSEENEMINKMREAQYARFGGQDRFAVLEKLLQDASPMERENLLKKFLVQ